MITGQHRFNIYLLVLAATFLCGCKTMGNKQDKQLSTLRVHLEVTPEPMDFSTTVKVFRAKPLEVTVDKSPFLTEANVSGAKVVEMHGGFALQIQFNQEGTWLLEEYTTTNPGRHLAIFSEFGWKKLKSRWLAAPMIRKRISDGVLTFTPDATREEAEEIALGLNNVAKKNKKSQW